jgi:hypothetical protein
VIHLAAEADARGFVHFTGLWQDIGRPQPRRVVIVAGPEQPAARVASVTAERLAGWVTRFGERHGPPTIARDDTLVVLTAPDGAQASVSLPFAAGPWLEDEDLLSTVVETALRERTIGAVLVRRGGFAVGLFQGRRLLSSKVGHGYVQGQTKAGGWSQQRYARRRENQANRSYADASDAVVRVLLPHLSELEAVVGGGDRAGVDAVLADHRLTAVQKLRHEPVLPTSDPRLRVLEAFADQFRAVRITVQDPAE